MKTMLDFRSNISVCLDNNLLLTHSHSNQYSVVSSSRHHSGLAHLNALLTLLLTPPPPSSRKSVTVIQFVHMPFFFLLPSLNERDMTVIVNFFLSFFLFSESTFRKCTKCIIFSRGHVKNTDGENMLSSTTEDL